MLQRPAETTELKKKNQNTVELKKICVHSDSLLEYRKNILM